MAKKPSAPITIGSVTSKDGTKIEYAKSGNGPALILVAGALGQKDSAFMTPYAAELAKNFTVYNYDRRGRGGSTDTLPYTVDKECQDIAALAKEAGGAPFVFGLSSGGALALEAALRGVPMSKLIVYEPPYMLPDAKGKPAPDFEAKLKRYAAEERRSEAVSYFMRTVGVPAFGVFIMKMLPFWKGLKATAHTLPYDARIMDGFGVPGARFSAIHVPTLVGTGEKSPKNLQNTAQELSKVLPKPTLRRLAKQNHGVKPSVIAPVIVEFCAAPTTSTNGRVGHAPPVAVAARAR